MESSKRSLAALLAALFLTPFLPASGAAQGNPELVPCGAPVMRTLDSGDVHEYVVSIPAGETAIIDSYTVSGALGLLKVGYENDTGSDESCSDNIAVPGSAGVTTLRISDCIPKNGESGQYTISASIVSESPSQCSRRLSCGIVPGGIDTPGGVLPYSFTGTAGENLNLLVTKFGSSERAARLRLFGPSGELLPGANSCNGSVRATLPATGVYTVLVGSCAAAVAGRFTMLREGDSCPQGPVITYFGVSRSDDIALQPDTFDELGRPVYIRPLGSGFSLVIEARPGVTGRQPGSFAFDYDANDPSRLPDLQLLLKRPLGFGTPAVCDIVSPQQAGIPSVSDLTFDGSQEVSRAINDLGCRFNNGQGEPRGRTETTDACTRAPVTLDFSFVDPSTTVQFCGPIARAWAFAPGDTVVKARVRDNQDQYSGEREIVLRAEGESPFWLSDVNASDLIGAPDFVYFSAQDAAHGIELWRTDGTRARTELARDIIPGPASSSPRNLVTLEEKTFFLANAPSDTLVWPAQGLPINSGPVSDEPPRGALTAVGNRLFFFVQNGSGLNLWTSTGEGQDGDLVTELSAQPIQVDSTVGSNGTFFFSVRSNANNMAILDLWRSDGTTTGTRRVHRFSYATNTDARLDSLTDVSGELFFVAGDRRFGYGLWTSDGTDDGTQPLRNFSTPPVHLTALDTLLFFAAADSAHGTELWRSDGTEAGTEMVADINPGPASANVHGLAAVSSRLFFAATDGTRGNELWSCGGTAKRAALVRDINPGPASSNPSAITGIAGALYLSADDGVHGSELWISDGTEAGTVLALDIDPGSGSGSPDAFTLRDATETTHGAIVFRGQYGPAGPKLWAVPALDSIISPFVCPGDCNADDFVTVDELVTGVNNSLSESVECLAMDRNNDGRITVNELVAAVNAALRGCVGV